MSDAAATIVPGQAGGEHDAAPDVSATEPAKRKAGFDVDEYLPNRREAIFLAGGAVLGGVLGVGGAKRYAAGGGVAADRNDAVEMTSKEAKDLLEAGNVRYVTGMPARPDQSLARRQVVAGGQNPFAVILSCADSRVPPEVLFDQGLGDLFVVRSAGQVVDRAVLGSLQYGVDHLETPLLVVLGHSGCGAVGATVDAVHGAAKAEKAGGKKAPADAHGAKASGAEKAHAASAVDDLVAAIRPAVLEAEEIGAAEDELLDVAISVNVERIVEALKQDAVLGAAASRRTVKVLGAVYDLGTGEVDWL